MVLLAESRSLLNHRVARLPQLLEVAVPSPDEATRRRLIETFDGVPGGGPAVGSAGGVDGLARATAGLTVLALRQLLRGAAYRRAPIAAADVLAKVDDFLQGELGDGVVEIKKPSHTLDDAVGFHRLKEFLRGELVPRIRDGGAADALPGAAVAGPIGGGKTFLFEALAGELGIPVLVLKSIRSQWFGQTDVLFERLRRTIEALGRVLIFVDEADTQFGSLGPTAHDTERRLTGKIQAMMSDPSQRGRVFWLLMTARIHRLSPDLRRPGRVGDLIIPVLDPEGADRLEFLDWVLAKALGRGATTEERGRLDPAVPGYSAAAFAALRSLLSARVRAAGRALAVEEVLAVARDLLPPDIEETRRYQTLQALVNCTRRSLLPDPGSGATNGCDGARRSAGWRPRESPDPSGATAGGSAHRQRVAVVRRAGDRHVVPALDGAGPRDHLAAQGVAVVGAAGHHGHVPAAEPSDRPLTAAQEGHRRCRRPSAAQQSHLDRLVQGVGHPHRAGLRLTPVRDHREPPVLARLDLEAGVGLVQVDEGRLGVVARAREHDPQPSRQVDLVAGHGRQDQRDVPGDGSGAVRTLEDGEVHRLVSLVQDRDPRHGSLPGLGPSVPPGYRFRRGARGSCGSGGRRARRARCRSR